MKILVDLHHTALYYSLQLLFEKRLGWELYRPIGMEWFDQDRWLLYPSVHLNTAKQYLTLEQCFKRDVHGFLLPDRMKLNENYRVEDGIYYVEDPSTQKVQRGITLEKFRSMDFDILISSVPSHIPIWNKLIQESQARAKHIFQIGNEWGHQSDVKNVLASTEPFPVPGDVNACFYHQEFDLDLFSYTPPSNHKTVFSFIHYMREMKLHHQYSQELEPDGWTFYTYGGGMQGDLCYMGDIAKKHQEKGWLWHVKPEGDGYGHTLFNSYACGRPAIINASYYQGKLGSHLLQDQLTCMDLSRYTVHEGGQLLRTLSEPERHQRMCDAAYQRFKQVVDFDAEFEKIKKFLENLR